MRLGLFKEFCVLPLCCAWAASLALAAGSVASWAASLAFTAGSVASYTDPFDRLKKEKRKHTTVALTGSVREDFATLETAYCFFCRLQCAYQQQSST